MPTHHPTDSQLPTPDTPEQLFEQLAEPTLRELFPSFDELPLPHQKLVRLLHTELAKGTLSDGTFHDLHSFLLRVWHSFNAGAMHRLDECLSTEDDIEADWIPASNSLHRMDQHLQGLLALADAIPPEDGNSSMSAWSHYNLRSSTD